MFGWLLLTFNRHSAATSPSVWHHLVWVSWLYRPPLSVLSLQNKYAQKWHKPFVWILRVRDSTLLNEQRTHHGLTWGFLTKWLIISPFYLTRSTDEKNLLWASVQTSSAPYSISYIHIHFVDWIHFTGLGHLNLMSRMLWAFKRSGFQEDSLSA